MEASSKVYVFRLKPHEDLKKSILDFAKEHSIHAGIILTCVGSLEQVNLRFANQASGSMRTGSFEIVSCTGTFSHNGTAHLHLSVADNTGNTIGGHLLDQNLIFTTAEIAIAELPGLHFDREIDPTYGYKELIVRDTKKTATPHELHT
jgi:predicted DNA-binding protein with PD1-like motif